MIRGPSFWSSSRIILIRNGSGAMIIVNMFFEIIFDDDTNEVWIVYNRFIDSKITSIENDEDTMTKNDDTQVTAKKATTRKRARKTTAKKATGKKAPAKKATVKEPTANEAIVATTRVRGVGKRVDELIEAGMTNEEIFDVIAAEFPASKFNVNQEYHIKWYRNRAVRRNRTE